MAALTQSNGKMVEHDDETGPDDRHPPISPEKPGFFTVYKKGQGYYTRLGTALGAMLLIVVLALFVYQQGYASLVTAFYTPQAVPDTATAAQASSINAANAAGVQHSSQVARSVAAGLTAVVVLIGAAIAWRIMNRPDAVDFLISTDSEMKKVNWTSGQELFGSTRIVIIFLFVIALLLFLIDVVTGLVFQLIGLLKFGILS